MHSSNDNGGGNKRTSSSSIIEQIGPGKYKIHKLTRERNKSNIQLDSSSAISAGSSEDKEKASGVVAEQFLIEVVMDIKELVKVFNLNNYACNKINTNFTIESKKIVGLFASGTDTKEYLRRMEKEIIERQYLGGSEVARKYYNYTLIMN